VQNFIKLSAAVHDSYRVHIGLTMLKTILPSIPRALKTD